MDLDIEAIFFDLDGTLIDSEKMAADVLISEIEKLGLSWNPSDAALITGRTWSAAFEMLYAKYVFPVAREELSERVLSAYRTQLKAEVKEVIGARAAVKSLHGSYPLALVSGSYREEIFLALDSLRIRDYFQVVLGAEDYPESKPSPAGYLKGVQLLGVRPDRCLVFEDSEAGIASGIAAGFKVVAITSTNHFRADTSGAHFFLDDLSLVTPEWVKSLKT